MFRSTRPRRGLARAVTIAAAVLAVGAGGIAAAAVPSDAAATAPAAYQPIPARSINLHTAYARALPRASHGPIRYQPERGHAAAQAAAATCAEPNCNVHYHGGQVQGTPAVYLLLWGPGWNTTAADAQYLARFYDGLCGSGDNWTSTMFQYSSNTATLSCTGPALAGGVFYNDVNPPPANVTPADIGTEADAFLQAERFAPGITEQVVVATQSGTCYTDGFAGSCGIPQSGSYCGWHTSSGYGETFTNLPYSPDAGGECGENFVNAGSAGTYDGFSIVGGHEFAESITDPIPGTGWEDLNDPNDGGGEIGDKCAWGGQYGGQGPGGGPAPIGDVTLATGTFAMQSLWSNSAGGCVMSPPPPDSVTITYPTGPQTSTLGTPVSLQIQASSADAYPITSYGAVGLPPGLSVSTSTGLISGTPTTAGSFSTRLQANDEDVGTDEPLIWTVNPPPYPAGIISGYVGCLDDYGSSAANGTKVDLYTCNRTSAQRWTLHATHAASGNYTGELVSNNGQCVNDAGYGGVGSKVILWTCTGSSNEVWTYWPKYREYSVTYGGRTYCTNDPGYSTAKGTQQIVWTCPDTANEQYSIPH